jgi:hypothetical protein
LNNTRDDYPFRDHIFPGAGCIQPLNQNRMFQ